MSDKNKLSALKVALIGITAAVAVVVVGVVG